MFSLQLLTNQLKEKADCNRVTYVLINAVFVPNDIHLIRC